MSIRQMYPGSIVKPGFNPLSTLGYVYNLFTWGNGGTGRLGLGNTTYYSSPKQVGALTTWKSVSSGYYYFTTAIKTDGTLWTWGYNGFGQLGLGNTTNYSSPKQVGALTNWSKIAPSITGGQNRLAIKTDGTLWSWGKNDNGQLGLGNLTNYSSPKQVGSLYGWLKVASGYTFTLAIAS